MRDCSLYRRASASHARLFFPQARISARLFFPQARFNARLFSIQARFQRAPVNLTGAHTCARVQRIGARSRAPFPESPAHVGPPSTHKPPKKHLHPPVPTLPKKLTPTTRQDVQTTNLQLARRGSGSRALRIAESPLNLLWDHCSSRYK
jgi:hypothetical protein